jgi:ferredoxin
MIQIIHQRNKCIGCNACVEIASFRWRMSRKDGKSILIGAKEKKGFYILHTGTDESEEACEAARNCPVKIIKVKELESRE